MPSRLLIPKRQCSARTLNHMGSRYRAVSKNVDGLPIAELHDSEWPAKVSVIPSIGNIAYEFLSKGTPVIWAPEGSPATLVEKKGLAGVPLLAPWANRLESDTYRLGELRHQIDPSLGNIRRDVNGRPIHGLMLFVPWEVVSLGSTDGRASLTCRFNFASRPDFLSQFTLPHRYEMTHTLEEGRLTVSLRVTNDSTEMLPLALGFHPYFSLGSAVRQDVTVKLPAAYRLELSDQMLPTGKTVDWNGNSEFPLGEQSFDDGFVGLMRGTDQTAVFEAGIGEKRLRVGFGPRYEVAVVYAPPTKQFLCFEPMTAVTNAFNTDGKEQFAGLPRLQRIEPGGHWEESFWVELN
jgi:aldose 1-epimerase